MTTLAKDELTRLAPLERIKLISQPWDSLEAEQIPLTSGQQAELERWLVSLDQDRAEGVTWAALRAELAQRCPQGLRSSLRRLPVRNVIACFHGSRDPVQWQSRVGATAPPG
jgi:putative addiction module component (TIGR02574 family)